MLHFRPTALIALALLALLVTPDFIVAKNSEEDDLAGEGGEEEGGDEGGAEEEDDGVPVDEKDVLVLTDANFNQTIADNKFIMVEFYAPWCGHCKTLKPEYAKAATELKAADPAVALAKVDATKEEGLAARFGVEGFPSLKWFREGSVKDFQGGRTADEIVSFCKKQSGEPTQKVATDEDLTALVTKSRVVVAGYFTEQAGDLYTAFRASALESEKVFAEPSADVAAKRGVSAPAIVVYKNFDEGLATYSGAANSTELLAFVSAQSRPMVFQFKEELIEDMFHNDLPKIAMFAYTEAHEAAMKDAAARASVRGKFVFMQVGKGEDPNFFEYMGVDPEGTEPKVMAIDAATGKKYQLEGDITADSIEKFATGVAAGTIPPFLKSAPIPEKQEGDVVEVVGKNFKDVVINSDKHVILEFYAPWCGHCQQLAPIYEKVATHFKETHPDDVVIAKIDGTANEVEEELPVEGFPTIFAFAKDKKSAPVDISSKPRKTAKAMITSISKALKLAAVVRPGEDRYREAVARLKKVLKVKPDLLEYVAGHLEKVADQTEAELKKLTGKDEL